MLWIESVNALDLAVRGMVVGIVASAPMGPVGVLTVQRTFNKGRWYGFATGCGAAVSDLIYAVMTGLGMSLVMDFVERPTTIFYLKILGSILLFCFGLYTYYTKPAEPHKPSGNRGTLWHNAFTGFLILTTALNRLGSRFDMSTISLLNRLLGLLVMVASVVGLFYTLFR